MDVKLNKGDSIIKQGDTESKFIYVVVKGELSVMRSFDGKEVHLTDYKAGDTFGEVSMILDKPRSATIEVSSKEAVIKKLDKKEFLKEIKSNPQLAWKLLEKLAARTENFDKLRGQFMKMNS